MTKASRNEDKDFSGTPNKCYESLIILNIDKLSLTETYGEYKNVSHIPAEGAGNIVTPPFP